LAFPAWFDRPTFISDDLSLDLHLRFLVDWLRFVSVRNLSQLFDLNDPARPTYSNLTCSVTEENAFGN